MRRRYPKYIDKGAYERTVSVIVDYPNIVDEYERRREYILDASPAPPDGLPRGNETSNPTLQKSEQLTSFCMLEMERKINAFHKAWGLLENNQRIIIEERYWKGKRLEDIDCYWSIRTIKRIIKRFIFNLAFYLGEID